MQYFICDNIQCGCHGLSVSALEYESIGNLVLYPVGSWSDSQ